MAIVDSCCSKRNGLCGHLASVDLNRPHLFRLVAEPNRGVCELIGLLSRREDNADLHGLLSAMMELIRCLLQQSAGRRGGP